MSLKARVKVGNVDSLSAARYCAGMGVDFLGFGVGEHGVSPVAYKEIIEWISGPEFILEAQHDQSLKLEDITANYPGHYIEINKDQLHWLDNTEYNFILFVHEDDLSLALKKTEGKTNLMYIEVAANTIENLRIEASLPVLLALTDPAWLERTTQLPIYGISLTSSSEERPGLMDYASIADVLETLEE